MSGDHKMFIKGNPGQYVKLNVGGSLHYTTIGTLTKQDSMLKRMFSGRVEVLTDSEGWIMIDRNGKHFGTILNFLRDDCCALPDNQRELQELLQESRYYCMDELTQKCDSAFRQKKQKNTNDLACNVQLITSPHAEQKIIQSTSKPVVKLHLNRHNNKYSYTSTSDENLLKNIELFDKLSLKYGHRLLFIKDVVGSNEICQWTFFGDSKKLSEVCCTSIVYATDKKHTKVDFPEARIFEETLHALLYETPACTASQKDKDDLDVDMMHQISAWEPQPQATTSDDEDERKGAVAAAVAGPAGAAAGLSKLRTSKN